MVTYKDAHVVILGKNLSKAKHGIFFASRNRFGKAHVGSLSENERLGE